ncbi:MAG: lipid A-modifier LpxR family protein [Bacteroidota bacterium]
MLLLYLGVILKSFCISLLIFLVIGQTFSQANYSETLHLKVDNDAFLFSQTDWYYSSGIYANYRKQIKKETALINIFPSKNKKIFRMIGIGHQVYTPRLFSSPVMELYDRPHAALLTGDYGLTYAGISNILGIKLSLGWMGPAIGTGPALVWFHGLVGWKTPRGWDYEISDSPVVQINLDWQKTFLTEQGVDFTFITRGQAGTIFVNSVAGIEMRLGRFLPIGNSIFFDQFTGHFSDRKLKELFFVLGGNFEYVLYDATIEGGFIGPDSPHVESPMSWIRNGQLGVGLGSNRLDIMVILNYRSPSTTEANRHKYVTIKMNYRL